MTKPVTSIWTTSSGRLNLVFTQDQVDSIPCSGPADDQIELLRPLAKSAVNPRPMRAGI